jgi:hypothetical protein
MGGCRGFYVFFLCYGKLCGLVMGFFLMIGDVLGAMGRMNVGILGNFMDERRAGQ